LPARLAGANDPTAARFPKASGEGVVRCRAAVGAPPKDRTTLAFPSVTLSNEKATSRSQACRHPRPAANAGQRAAHGRAALGPGLAVPLPFDREVS
jgi:hypothetical protein